MKKSITEQLDNVKRYHTPKKWASWFHHFIMNVVLGKSYNAKYHIIDSVSDCDGPCFVIYNHQSRVDHGFCVGATYPRRINFIVGRNEFYRKKFKFPFKIGGLVPKRNYAPDIKTIKMVSRIIKSGGCVAFSPEGLASNYGTNKPIVPGTSKMFKHFKCPVYFCHYQGAYLESSKVCLDVRPGEVHVELYKLFSVEDIERLTDEEMDDIINEKFKTNEYAWNKEQKIKYKTKNNAAYRLEDFLYRCPTCGKEFTMKGEKNIIKCNSCGCGATIDDYYMLHKLTDNSILPLDIATWVEEERLKLIHEIRDDQNYSFSDEVKLGTLNEYKYVKDSNFSSFIVGEGTVTVDHQGLHYQGTRDNQPYQFDMDYNELYTTITIMDASYFSFWHKGEFFDIVTKHQTVGKFILLIEEMHRYHVNYYKNFKWNDWMYEGLALGIDNQDK